MRLTRTLSSQVRSIRYEVFVHAVNFCVPWLILILLFLSGTLALDVAVAVVVIGEHRLDVARFIDISSDQLKGLVTMTGGSSPRTSCKLACSPARPFARLPTRSPAASDSCLAAGRQNPADAAIRTCWLPSELIWIRWRPYLQ